MQVRSWLSVVSVGLVVVPRSVAAQGACESPWVLEETLRIGSIDGEVTLTWVRDLEVGPDGDIYVSQGWDQSVAVFGADGRPRRTIGRAGSGPGEFGSAPHQLLLRGDTLVVTGRFASHFLTLDGTEVRRVSFRVPVPSEASTFVPGTPLADGSFLGYRFVSPPIGRFFMAPRVALRRFSATGDVIDTIAVVRQLPAVEIEALGDEYFDHMARSHPLADWWSGSGESWLPVTATKDGSAVVFIGDVRNDGGSASYQLLTIGIDGDTLFDRRVAYEPRRITSSEREQVREGFAAALAGDFLGSRGVRPPLARAARLRQAARRALSFPDSYPPVRQIVTGSDGSIWLLRVSAPLPADIWEIHGPDGALEGSVRISEGRTGPEPWAPRLRIFRATRDEVWGTTVGDFDVPYLHRYRVDRACP